MTPNSIHLFNSQNLVSSICTSDTAMNITSTTTNLVVSYSSTSNNSSGLDNHLNIFSNLPYVFNESPLYSVEKNEMHNFASICDKLRFWVVKYNVSHNCCNSLLQIIKSEGLKVPKDIRTLMKTPKSHNIFNLSNGSYIHLGIENMLVPILKKYNAPLNNPSHILKIGINIDGLPISRSSKSQLWPILISILNFKELINNVIPIGIYHGEKKPNSIEEYMNPFILDLLNVMKSGLGVNGSFMKFEMSNIVCDAPAKSFILNAKSHNAYFWCTSCIEESTYVCNRVVFSGIDSPLRTDFFHFEIS